MPKEDNPYYKIDDNCYVLNNDNKIKYCEVTRVITEDNSGVIVYQLRDLIDYRYFVAKHETCFDTEAAAKKFKSARSGKNKTTDKIRRQSKKK